LRKLKIAYICQHPDYEKDFVLRLIKTICEDRVQRVSPRSCDLLIAGPFRQKMLGLNLKYRRAYKLAMMGRKIAPLVLYQTGENTRWNSVQSDYSISFDLGVTSANHIRFPLWMSMFDWSQEGGPSFGEERFGPPVKMEHLLRPLGAQDGRLAKAILISSHQKEPRATLLAAVRSVMEVECYGKAFPENAHRSFLKLDVCRDKQFALCPENSMSPGYYTEKIPDAFATGCIPITWCDENVRHDFNPEAIINLARFASTGYVEGLRKSLEPHSLASIREQPLLLHRPTLDGIRAFLTKIILEASS
jgi:hypothetical protein